MRGFGGFEFNPLRSCPEPRDPKKITIGEITDEVRNQTKEIITSLRESSSGALNYAMHGILHRDVRVRWDSELRAIPGFSEAVSVPKKEYHEDGHIIMIEGTDYTELIKNDDFCLLLADIIMRETIANRYQPLNQ